MRRRASVVGILLAAGASRRMGTLKQLLPFGERTVLEQGVRNFRAAGITPVVVALGHAADAIRNRLPDLFDSDDVIAAINERHAEGMLSSIQRGVREARRLNADAVVLALVDQPFIPSSVYRNALDAYLASDKRIVIPRFGDKRGHPIVLTMELCDEVLTLGGPGVGLRDLIRARVDDTLIVPVAVSEILRDMDTPEDYHSELKRWLRRNGAGRSDG